MIRTVKLMPYRIAEIILSETPLRLVFFRFILKYLFFIPYNYRLTFKAVERPHYGYCIYQSLRLAHALGYKKISIIEFGVAGGKGLLNIEHHVKQLQKIVNIEVEIYGFDLGSGLPTPKGYKDSPYLWKKGFYQMDIPKLKNRLRSAKLVLGEIKKTLKDFKCAPVACVLFDLDYYSSTMDAFEIFDKPHLPRVFCYFDDAFGSDVALRNEYTGELRAINEFNKKKQMKIVQLKEDISYRHRVFIMHDFKHPQYNIYVNFQDDGSVCDLK